MTYFTHVVVYCMFCGLYFSPLVESFIQFYMSPKKLFSEIPHIFLTQTGIIKW